VALLPRTTIGTGSKVTSWRWQGSYGSGVGYANGIGGAAVAGGSGGGNTNGGTLLYIWVPVLLALRIRRGNRWWCWASSYCSTRSTVECEDLYS
jgi:hypothetical protein